MSNSQRPALPDPADGPSDRFFSSIGIAPGARVLDVGCGGGDLSRFLAGLTGPEGEVVAIDRSEQALEMARAIEGAPSDAAIVYRRVDLADDLPDMGSFDAFVGRRVLMYLAGALRTREWAQV